MVTTRSRASSSLASKRTLDEGSSLSESKKSRTKKKTHEDKGTKKKAVSTAKTSGLKTEGKAIEDAKVTSNEEPLLCLDEDMISGTLLCRPSKRNRSPYVADLLLKNDDEDGTEREAIIHVPNLDMGGKCVPGATLFVKPARDKKGNLVGPNAVNPKFGTPKCEFITQLLRVDETNLGYEPPVWVGAHPSLGEKIAEELIRLNKLHPELPKIKNVQREVRNICGADMRADFVISFEDSEKHKPCVLEVKTVVDTDFAADRIPADDRKCLFASEAKPYRRAGIFPWGSCNQKGPSGEKVVSARAIKHLRELTKIAQGKLKGDDGTVYQAAVLFVVIRKDAEYFRPNHEACPSFCRYLKDAEEAGVTVLAKRVDWGDESDTVGKCFEGPLLDIQWPSV